MYASFLGISRAVHLDVFEQPGEKYFFNNLLPVIFRRLTSQTHLRLQQSGR
jgi:hypothetical protein